MPTSGVSSASLPHQHQHNTSDDWPIESQKVKDEQIQAFYREYAKRIATALTQHTSLGKLGGNAALLEETLQDPIVKPSQEELMELYTNLLRDNQDLHPRIKQVLTDQSFVVSSFTSSLAERLEKQLAHPRPTPASPQRAPCGCPIGHGDHDSLDFPDDSYEDEPDEESFDDDDEDDDDEDDADYDDEDDEDDDDDDDNDDDSPGDDDDEDYDETYDDGIDDGIDDGVIDGYSNHYQDSEVSIALEEERRKFAAILKRRDEGKRRLEEEFRRKSLLNIQKRNLEAERIQLLQRLRLEDEERRKKEQQEKERKERLDQEIQRKREAAEADQSARSFLFESTANGHIGVVKKMLEATPAASQSIAGVPRFFSTTATRLTGWEYVTLAEGDEEVNEKRGIQETLLHVAARAGSLELVEYLISRGAPLDSMDSEGRTPLHTAAEHSASLDIVRLLLEKGAHYMDRSSTAAGKTALHYAAQTGNGALVAMLLQHHARVSAVDAHGNTPEMLAKAGLDREKGSKAKAKPYREALQHIQQALAAIKEAQKQRDAALEEQRKREEELAREEAEKDRAARRKQEEKLEADKRRREEEEKELARLKALASDPHGQNSGGSAGKKKKKKKGKGTESQAGKDATTPNKSQTTPALPSALARSNASTPVGSPAVSHTTAVVTPSPATPQSRAAATSGDPSPKAALPKGAPSATPVAGSATPHTAASTPALKSTVKTSPTKPDPPVPTRLPKAKTSYRPSQLVVARMADMGFPERESRKALIQTEGKFEEAIELLTSGAPLADDSEDEAEQKAAKDAARLKARASEVSSRSGVSSTEKRQGEPANTFSQGKSNGGTPPSSVPSSTATSKSGPGLQQQQQQQQDMLSVLSGSISPAGSASGSGVKQVAPPKGAAVGHPVQILQRTPAMAPHVQLRSVPTQVLQRPSHHSQAHTPKTQSNVISGVPTSTAAHPVSTPLAAPTITKRDTTPFLPPRVNPPLPPTRAPYSYGSSAQKSLDAGHGNGYSVHPAVHVRPGARPALQSRSASAPAPAPAPAPAQTPAMAALETALSATLDSALDYDTPADIMWDTRGSNQMSSSLNLSPMNLSQTHINMTSNVASTAQDNLWGSASLLHPQTIVGKGVSAGHAVSSSFQSSLLTGPGSPSTPTHDRYHSALSPSSALITASMSDMLRQSQMDMMDNGDAEDDEDMIKDVLAMTGAIDAEDLAESFSEYSLLGAPTSSQSDSRRAPVAAAPVASAVGQGRTSAAVSSNPVASLWGYGAFTHDIAPLLSQSQSTTATHLSFDDYQSKSMGAHEDVFGYNQRNHGAGFGMNDSRRELQHQGPISYHLMQDRHKTTFSDDLVGSPSAVYDPSLAVRRRSSTAAAEANRGMFGERDSDANRQQSGSHVVVENDNGHRPLQSHLGRQQQQQQQYYLRDSLLSPSSPSGARPNNNTHQSPSISSSTGHGPSPSSASLSPGYGFGSPMGSASTKGSRWGNQPPGLTSSSVSTGAGTGSYLSDHPMQPHGDTDRASPSRGVQALNEALAFSRYPKLDRPDKSSLFSTTNTTTTTTTTATTTTPPSATFSAPAIDSPQRQRRDPWGR
ncbi:hypothetical protein EC968_010382 [Mortierella alpina]|nr:hypothetical protein EC968_010382 [Mortierella alpina]